MKFIKIVWSLHCLWPLDPVCSLQKTFQLPTRSYLVRVAKPPRATTRVFLSHLSWQPSSLLTTPLNLQYWEEERTNTPGSEAVGQSPAGRNVMIVLSVGNYYDNPSNKTN